MLYVVPCFERVQNSRLTVSLQCFKDASPSFLTCIVSEEKYLFLFYFTYVQNVTFCLCFISAFELFDYNMSRCSFLHASFAWGSLSSLNLWLYTFQQIGGNDGHYFFKYFLHFLLSFFSLGYSSYIYIRPPEEVLQLTNSFIQFIFSFCSIEICNSFCYSILNHLEQSQL